MQPPIKRWMLPLAPVLAVAIAIGLWAGGMPGDAAACGGVAIVCALWWMFECLDIAIVGLLPLVSFPMLGVLDHRQTAEAYGHSIIWLLMGGFFLSAAMERSGAHRRIALGMVRMVGGRGGRRLVLGFMLATASLSMWISNAATTLMMLPIAMAILDRAGDPKLRTPLLLGIAYAASVGGMATPIGTPSNVVFMGYMDKAFDVEFSFAAWMRIGIPIVLCLLPTIWWWLTRGLDHQESIEMPDVGAMPTNQRRVLFVFVFTAAAWVFRTGPYGGWGQWMPVDADGKTMIGDTTVAIAASMFLFVCPSGESNGESIGEYSDESSDGHQKWGDRQNEQNGDDEVAKDLASSSDSGPLLDWPTAVSIPWGILLMFGGGLALSAGFQQTGLSQMIGSQLSIVAMAPLWITIAVVCLLMNFLTELTSSTATATLMMPVLGSLAIATGLPPETILIPGTISASCAFMLPVATAPNVIVFGAGGLSTKEMASYGFMLNILAAIVVVTASVILLT